MQPNSVEQYRNALAADVYTCMEMSRQSYTDVMKMPLQRLYDYLKWKTNLEEEKQKRIEEETKKQSGKSFG